MLPTSPAAMQTWCSSSSSSASSTSALRRAWSHHQRVSLTATTAAATATAAAAAPSWAGGADDHLDAYIAGSTVQSAPAPLHRRATPAVAAAAAIADDEPSWIWSDEAFTARHVAAAAAAAANTDTRARHGTRHQEPPLLHRHHHHHELAHHHHHHHHHQQHRVRDHHVHAHRQHPLQLIPRDDPHPLRSTSDTTSSNDMVAEFLDLAPLPPEPLLATAGLAEAEADFWAMAGAGGEWSWAALFGNDRDDDGTANADTEVSRNGLRRVNMVLGHLAPSAAPSTDLIEPLAPTLTP
ncbi:hypothetical protein HK405_005539 [Cladochytrium tenue]|nr:hypothetical protein HK405_005539 [Cladochytrium tenue]